VASKKWTKTAVCSCCGRPSCILLFKADALPFALLTLTFDRIWWCYNIYNYEKWRPQGITCISTENRPATVRLSGGRRAVAAWSLNRRTAAVINGLSPARSQGGGSLILAAAALTPYCHSPGILGCHVSREPLKPTVADMQHFVGSYMWLLSA